MFKKLLFPAAIAGVFMASFVLTSVATNNTNMLNVFGTGAYRNTNYFYVDSSGNTHVAGTLAVTGNVTNSGDLAVTGAVSSEDLLTDDAAVHESFYMGLTTAISSFTPTALTLDDGLTLTVNGRFVPPSATEAVLKTTTPTATGETWYDSTNKALVIGTGTTNCNDWGQANAGGTAPAGW